MKGIVLAGSSNENRGEKNQRPKANTATRSTVCIGAINLSFVYICNYIEISKLARKPMSALQET